MDTPLFELAGVSFSVPGRAILEPLDLVLRPGRVHGLIGANGSGKSTLVKMLARQTRPSAGTIRLEGVPLDQWNGRALARTLAYMPQFTPPSDGMTVRELVALGRFPWHGTLGRFTALDGAKVDEALARTGLEAMAGRSVDSLSGGERQRVWLALMLAQDPKCLLLDEPTSALDIAHESEILALVRAMTRERGMAAVVVLHDINLAARTCDDIIALRGGRMIAHETANGMMTPETLSAVYGVPMGVIPHPTRGDPMGYIL